MIRIDVDAVAGPADTGDLSMDIAGLFVEVGKLARDHDTGVLLTIDEIHYVPLLSTPHLSSGCTVRINLACP